MKEVLAELQSVTGPTLYGIFSGTQGQEALSDYNLPVANRIFSLLPGDFLKSKAAQLAALVAQICADNKAGVGLKEATAAG